MSDMCLGTGTHRTSSSLVANLLEATRFPVLSTWFWVCQVVNLSMKKGIEKTFFCKRIEIYCKPKQTPKRMETHKYVITRMYSWYQSWRERTMNCQKATILVLSNTNEISNTSIYQEVFRAHLFLSQRFFYAFPTWWKTAMSQNFWYDINIIMTITSQKHMSYSDE